MEPASVKILSFVNHVAPSHDVHECIAQAFDWGVDAIVAQGTGTDWGPFWLGSGTQMDTANFKANVRPYLQAADSHGVPFVLSVGIAGASVHLEECLARVDELCTEDNLDLNIGVIDTEISKPQLKAMLAEGREIRAAYDVPALSPLLERRQIDDAERIVGLLGPEPIMDLLADESLSGVITGRAVDIALYMALPMLRGVPIGIAAHAGKVLECGGLSLEPGDPSRSIWAAIDDQGFEVRSPSRNARVTTRGMAAHGFYERANPFEEANPGGKLDLHNAKFDEVELGVRCTGATWIPEPYTLLIEGAHLEGYRSIVLMGVRERALLDQVDNWTAQVEADVADAERFAHLKRGVDYDLVMRVYGRDGVLGELEPESVVQGHEAAVIFEVLAATQALATEIAYFGFIRSFAGPYPGRKTTAGNAAIPYMPMAIPIGPMYSFSIYHILPVNSPSEPFNTRRLHFPRQGAK